MIIQITPDGFIHVSGDVPEIGRKYSLEDVAEGSLAQGKAFHALIQEYWKSGAHSYQCDTFDRFRDLIKRDIGAGFESYVYADETGLHKVKTLAEIPESVPLTHKMGKLKSWADYTKKERREAIDRVIAEMIQAGVNSKKFHEILQGMEDGNGTANQ